MCGIKSEFCRLLSSVLQVELVALLQLLPIYSGSRQPCKTEAYVALGERMRYSVPLAARRPSQLTDGLLKISISSGDSSNGSSSSHANRVDNFQLFHRTCHSFLAAHGCWQTHMTQTPRTHLLRARTKNERASLYRLQMNEYLCVAYCRR